MLRAALLAKVSAKLGGGLRPRALGRGADAGGGRREASRGASVSARARSCSYAERGRSRRRSAGHRAGREHGLPFGGSAGPTREAGGAISVRCTMPGVPLSSSIETSASPTASSVIACSTRKSGIGAECLGGRPHRLLILGGERAQRVLNPVAELRQHVLRHIGRVLGDEEDADALRADQPDHLLDFVHQRLRRVVEQQVRLVEEQHQLRPVAIADLRQLLEQLGEQPEQEGGIETGLVDQPIGGEDADDALAGLVDCIRSLRSSAGSPKKASPPSRSRTSSLRWMAPT